MFFKCCSIRQDNTQYNTVEEYEWKSFQSNSLIWGVKDMNIIKVIRALDFRVKNLNTVLKYETDTNSVWPIV